MPGKFQYDVEIKTNVAKLLENMKEVQDRLDDIEGKEHNIKVNINKNKLQNDITELGKVIAKYQKTIDSYAAKPKPNDQRPQYKETISKVRDEIKSLQILQESLQSSGTPINEQQLKLINEYRANIDKLILSLKSMPAVEKGSTATSRLKLMNRIGDYMNRNTAMSKEFRNELQGLYDELKDGDSSIDFGHTIKEFERIKGEIHSAGQEGKRFWDVVKERAWSGAAQVLGTYFGINDLIRYFKEGVGVVRELNTALTEMRKVSDETEQSLRKYQKTTFDTADDVGTTAKQIQNSTADWQRLGYGLEESAALAKNSNIYKNVGDMEIDEATEHMISSVQAWKSEFGGAVETSEAIMNRYNKIGNEFAISSADIGDAMERSAAALKAGRNNLNESLGIITAGNVIQQDASTTASAMKILSLRIRGAKADLEEMGESTDDLADSTSKMREELKALTGVDIMLDENTFKSTAQIIKEIGANWSKMTDVSQAATLEKIAGKNRASTVAGLIENYQIIDDVIKAAENADNSALEENAKYIDSVDGKLQQLTNRSQEFWATVIDDKALMGGIDLLTKLIKGVTDFIDKIGTLPTLIGAIGAAFSLKNVGRDKMYSLNFEYADSAV